MRQGIVIAPSVFLIHAKKVRAARLAKLESSLKLQKYVGPVTSAPPRAPSTQANKPVRQISWLSRARPLSAR